MPSTQPPPSTSLVKDIGLAPERLAILDHPPTSNVCLTAKSKKLRKHEVAVDMLTNRDRNSMLRATDHREKCAFPTSQARGSDG